MLRTAFESFALLLDSIKNLEGFNGSSELSKAFQKQTHYGILAFDSTELVPPLVHRPHGLADDIKQLRSYVKRPSRTKCFLEFRYQYKFALFTTHKTQFRTNATDLLLSNGSHASISSLLEFIGVEIIKILFTESYTTEFTIFSFLGSEWFYIFRFSFLFSFCFLN